MVRIKNILCGGVALLGAIIVGATPHGARATTNLVQNGDFEQVGGSVTGPEQILGSSIATDWTVSAAPGSSYAFLFSTVTGKGPVSHGSLIGDTGNTFLSLYGPNGATSGSAADAALVSPTGGNFVGMDGAYQVSALSQSVSGLVVGGQYALSFYMAGAQQQGFTGTINCAGDGNPNLNNCTTDQWDVSLGSQTLDSTNVTTPGHGFSGWMEQTLIFTATATTQTLSFLAQGQLNGSQPPFALLDGVSLTAVPEPTTLVLMLSALGGFGAIGLRRRKRAPERG